MKNFAIAAAIVLCGCGGETPDESGKRRDALSPADALSEETRSLVETRTRGDRLDGAEDVDATLLAEEQGLPVEQVRDWVKFRNAFEAYVAKADLLYPGHLAAIWIEPAPTPAAHIVFVGDVPDDLDAESGVELRGGATLSMSEQYVRAEHLSEALTQLGYKDHTAFYDHKSQRLKASVRPNANGALVQTSVLATRTTELLVTANAVNVRATIVAPGDLDVEPKIETITPLANARGGHLITGPTSACTSGWVVANTTTWGIATARHCGQNMNVYQNPSEPAASMSLLGYNSYSLGDAQWYSTSLAEIAEFRADTNDTRHVWAWKATDYMVGDSVCYYGVFSNDRYCSNVVNAVNLCANFTGIGTICKQAKTLASPNKMIGGDSGGGASWGNTAYGTLTGGFAGGNYFTPMDQIHAALFVNIQLYPYGT